MTKPTVLCLFGGKSSEYEVSLNSAYSILSNIDREKYNVITVGITKDGDWCYYDGSIENIPSGTWLSHPLKRAVLSPSPSDKALFVLSGDRVEKIPVDVIFPVMHGANAEDGTLQGLMQLSGIPYVGCGCVTSAIAMDKGFTKLVVSHYGIPQAKSDIIPKFRLEKDIDGVIEACEAVSEYPLFVKPANAGSSVGASKAKNRDELISALNLAAEHDTKIIVEEYIKGKEVEIAVIGNEPMGADAYIASTPGNIDPGAEFYDYDAKYSAASTSSATIPADISPETAKKAQRYAKIICSALGVTGLSRVDFFVCETDGEEKIIFNEINTLPGFTTISMYPKLLIHDGMSYPEIIDRLIALAVKKER